MKAVIKKIMPVRISRGVKDMVVTVRWFLNSSKNPPPNWLKQRMIIRILERFNLPIFIETGTFLGEMVRAVRDKALRIFSIELSHDLASIARRKFLPWPHINIIEGDSAKVLKDICSRINQPCLFWLDGHFSGGVTARGERVTPILSELETIFNTVKTPYIILIDDARLFNGNDDYPSLENIKNFIFRYLPNASVEIVYDSIRIIHIPL